MKRRTSANKKKVVRIRKKHRFSVGILILLFLAYIIIIVISSLTKKHISVYEVTKRSVSDNDTLRGIILRDEELVTAPSSGYINYFVGEGQKAGVSTNVYSLDQTGNMHKKINSRIEKVQESGIPVISYIRDDIADFRTSYSPSDFDSLYSLKYSLSNTLEGQSVDKAMIKINKVISSGKNAPGFSVYTPGTTGIVSYISDGEEDLKFRDIDENSFNDTSENWKTLRKDDYIDRGDTVYKLIKNNRWSVAVQLSKDQYNSIKKQGTRTRIVLKRIGITVSPETRLVKRDGIYLARFDMSDYMIDYLNDRYIDIQLAINGASGLQVPVSSVVKKKAYLVPRECVSHKIDDTNVTGVYMLRSEAGSDYGDDYGNDYVFVPVNIYTTSKDDDYYINAPPLREGLSVFSVNESGVIQQNKSSKLKAPKTFDGVYNCNYGYCKFNVIDILNEGPEYDIVSEKTPFGLSQYDHIVLNADLISENDLIE